MMTGFIWKEAERKCYNVLFLMQETDVVKIKFHFPYFCKVNVLLVKVTDQKD